MDLYKICKYGSTSIMKLLKLYALATIPSTVIAAEAISTINEVPDSLISIFVQWGLGAVVGVVAVKMLLVLYKDKEQNIHEYHHRLLELTTEQINAIKDTKHALENVERTLEEHNLRFSIFTEQFKKATDELLK